MPKAKPGLTTYSRVFQTPKPTLLPMLPSCQTYSNSRCPRPVAGVEHPQVGNRPKQIDPVFSFHISLLTGSAGSWESGEGLPTLSHLQLRSWDSCTTPLQGHQPPIVGRVMPEFLFSFPGNPIQMSGQGSSDTYFEL